VAQVSNGRDAVTAVQTHQPDVAILDWKMPQMDGLEAIAKIRAENGQTVKILLLTGAPIDGETAVLDALEKGIDGFVSKDVSPARLAHAIRRVAQGERYIGAEIRQALLDYGREKKLPPAEPAIVLSGREQEILELMATAMTYKEMAEKLILGEETVRTYVKRVLAKLGQPNRTQAVIAAIRLKLISV